MCQSIFQQYILARLPTALKATKVYDKNSRHLIYQPWESQWIIIRSDTMNHITCLIYKIGSPVSIISQFISINLSKFILTRFKHLKKLRQILLLRSVSLLRTQIRPQIDCARGSLDKSVLK
ncbi:PREDICTED: uncharacterized protein LOC108686908 [Atta colombica]|uniref:uncharacterized protein LOC108686908 n=1 Tax=Atta colombica TaxID=520822 RepID=UPI00084BE320|nr:PREDICTED: uncharacterized protein LOC108686908 [Atta colombica]